MLNVFVFPQQPIRKRQISFLTLFALCQSMVSLPAPSVRLLFSIFEMFTQLGALTIPLHQPGATQYSQILPYLLRKTSKDFEITWNPIAIAGLFSSLQQRQRTSKNNKKIREREIRKNSMSNETPRFLISPLLQAPS